MNLQKELRAIGKGFDLTKIDPGFTGGLTKETAADLQAAQLTQIQELQDRLYAENRNAILLILQGIDASGKDGVIKHVMSGINPAGCLVIPFKTPTERENRHGFLWRHMVATPPKGIIGIFNRSHYEEVLIVRVHPEYLQRQHLPEGFGKDKDIWKKRYQAINSFEEYLVNSGIRVIKILLHISKGEQGKRFLSRLEDPQKNWKFSIDDLEERKFWDDYQNAFQEMIRHTSTRHAPWHVVPADRKWFARTAVGQILVKTLEEIDPQYPEVGPEKRRELSQLGKALRKQIC